MEDSEVNKEDPKEPVHEVKHTKKFRFKKIGAPDKNLWVTIGVIVALAVIITLSCWIRTRNIHDLKDITTGNYTLGPDLDPFFFLREAKEIIQYGHELSPDMMRYAPIGVPAYQGLNGYLIAWNYKFLHLFDRDISIEFTAILFPIIFFALLLISFFLLLERLLRPIMNRNPRLIASVIATALIAVVPEMLHRAMGGIPEHEGPGFFFMLLALYFFIWAFQDKSKKVWILSVLAGLSTALAMLAWGGGARYIFMIIGLFALISFLFNKIEEREFSIYLIWLLVSIIVSGISTAVIVQESIMKGMNIAGTLKSLTDTGFAFAILFVLIIDMLFWKTKLKKVLRLDKIKLPKAITSLIIIIIIGLIAIILVKPTAITGLFSKVAEGLLHPFGTTRIPLTVAENKAPYFADNLGSFSWMVWLFLLGLIFLFYEAIAHFGKKKKVWLTIFFIIFLITFVFSRISSQSILNGDNSISHFLYFGGLILFVVVLFYTYIAAYIKRDEKTVEDFKSINFSYILLLALSFWMLVSMRGAVRLFFLISPAIMMISAILPVRLTELAIKTKDNLSRMLLWCAAIIISIFIVLSFVSYARVSAQQAKYTVPGPYEQQWQKAMAWTRENTPEKSIFAHWWDYGYWVQTIGERPTILDGGNGIPFWNYLMGRYVLTGQNETEALEFLYAHNASYLLIDSSDIGKYPAYSSIGSDETGKDRLSWISTFVIDEKQTLESANGTRYVYVGGTMLDQDITWQSAFFPQDKAGIGAFIMSIDSDKKITDATAVLVYNGKQTPIPIRYVYADNKLIDVAKDREALNSTLYLVPRLTNDMKINNIGGAFYLSEKLMKSEMVKLYLLNETENFELVHSEPALFVQQIHESNYTIGDFLIANDVYGPIKIWKINYPKDFTVEDSKIKRYLQFESDLPFPLW